MLANPEFTFHLKRSVRADLPAKAIPVRDKVRRRNILQHVRGPGPVLDRWVAGSPLVLVELQPDNGS